MNFENIWALIISFALVFAVIGISELLKKRGIVGDEGSRKIIHIGVSNWWFLMFYLFDNIYLAIIPPIIFIILNYVSYKTNLIKSMERNGNGNLGTVYFPISLLLLVIASFTFTTPLVGGVGILILGYGDGLAALVGKKLGNKKILGLKTWVGTITMFLVSFIVSLILMSVYTNIELLTVIVISMILALVASTVELITPKGLDNLTIPILVSLTLLLILMVI